MPPAVPQRVVAGVRYRVAGAAERATYVAVQSGERDVSWPLPRRAVEVGGHRVQALHGRLQSDRDAGRRGGARDAGPIETVAFVSRLQLRPAMPVESLREAA